MTLNIASFVLVVLPAYQIAQDFYVGSQPQVVDHWRRFPGLDGRIAEAKRQVSRDELRDIYYIILDAYPRSGSPPEFDNSEFVQELESRGFYVATQARSNYRWTTLSIPSSLNMYYVHDEYLSPGNKSSRRLAAQADDHALGRILTTLGYRYVHVASGIEWSNTSRSADLVVDFTPAGLLLSGDKTEDPFAFKRATSLSSRFTDSLLPTTVARPFLSSEFDIHPDDPFAYRWQHPLRTLAWLDFQLRERAGLSDARGACRDLPYPLDAETAAAVEAALEHRVVSWNCLRDAETIEDWVLDDPTADEYISDAALASTVRRVERRLKALVRSKVIRSAKRVSLPALPHAFLSAAPLLDGRWIDVSVLELAELGVILADGGFRRRDSVDPHPLAREEFVQLNQRGEPTPITAGAGQMDQRPPRRDPRCLQPLRGGLAGGNQSRRRSLTPGAPVHSAHVEEAPACFRQQHGGPVSPQSPRSTSSLKRLT